MKRNIAATLLLFLTASFASDVPAQTWTLETVAPDTDYFDFAIDAAGTLHVLYTSVATPPDAELVYAFDSGAGWQFDVVPGVPGESLISLVVDDSGVPHIAFLDTTETIHYGYRDGGTWVVEPLQPADYPLNPSIALDGTGEPHIVFLTYGERIRYAFKTGGAWTDEEVNGSFLDISHSRAAIAIDPSGDVHVGSWEYFAGVSFFTRGVSSWTHENFGEWGYMPWMVLDDDGYAHFVYDGGDGPHYGTNQSSAWETETVDPNALLSDNDITLDSSGEPYIAYSNTYAIRYEAPDFYYHTDIYFAYRAGGVWRWEVVDSAHDYSSTPFTRTRVAFDGSGTPHVIYRDAGTGELKHGSRNWATAVSDEAQPGRFGIVSVMPNPFNPGTTIVFRLPGRSHVQVAVYDVRGRRLRVLSDRPRGPGDQSERWNGLDDRGARVASGVYFVRVKTPTRSDVRRVVLLK